MKRLSTKLYKEEVRRREGTSWRDTLADTGDCFRSFGRYGYGKTSGNLQAAGRYFLESVIYLGRTPGFLFDFRSCFSFVEREALGEVIG